MINIKPNHLNYMQQKCGYCNLNEEVYFMEFRSLSLLHPVPLTCQSNFSVSFLYKCDHFSFELSPLAITGPTLFFPQKCKQDNTKLTH